MHKLRVSQWEGSLQSGEQPARHARFSWWIRAAHTSETLASYSRTATEKSPVRLSAERGATCSPRTLSSCREPSNSLSCREQSIKALSAEVRSRGASVRHTPPRR